MSPSFVAFISFLGDADPFADMDGLKHLDLRKDKVLRVNMALADFDGKNANEIFRALTVTTVSEDPETLQALYDEVKGRGYRSLFRNMDNLDIE